MLNILHSNLNVIFYVIMDILDIFATSKPVNIAEQIYVELKRMLFDYEIVIGQKLQCQDLADKFKVSRTPIKDALNMLEKEGYVELRHNKGYYVAEIGLKEAEELYDIREALETFGVQKAIQNLSQDSLNLLKQTMEAYSENVNKKELSRRRLILDADFHLKIAGISGNTSLVMMLRIIISKIYLKHKIENLPPQWSIMADNEHKNIYNAISSKNTSAAIKEIRRHIALSRNVILGPLVPENNVKKTSTTNSTPKSLR